MNTLTLMAVAAAIVTVPSMPAPPPVPFTDTHNPPSGAWFQGKVTRKRRPNCARGVKEWHWWPTGASRPACNGLVASHRRVTDFASFLTGGRIEQLRSEGQEVCEHCLARSKRAL